MNLKEETASKETYLTNDCGVVTNPDTFYYFKPEKSLAWVYWKITTGICTNGLWDYGYTLGGGGGPCSFGRWETREGAIEEAVKKFDEYFKKGLTSGSCVPKKDFNKGYEAWQSFMASRGQLSLF